MNGQRALDNPAAEHWEGMHSCKATITRQHLHHHAKQVLEGNADIKRDIEAAIESVREIACVTRGRKGSALGADPEHFNLELRRGLMAGGGWSFEARIQDGIFFDSSERAGAKVGGFDFCKYDAVHNLANLWDYCFGQRAIKDGKKFWDQETSNRRHWTSAKTVLAEAGNRPEKHEPTVIGEIQFGNWAMAFRDYLKVLDGAEQQEIDLFVYLVPDGQLSRLMSDGTVNFDKATKYLLEVKRAMTVPTWIVGIDVEVGPLTGPLSAKVAKSRGTRVARRPS